MRGIVVGAGKLSSLVAVLCLVIGVAGSSGAISVRTAIAASGGSKTTRRAEARKLIAPLRALNRATRPKRAQVRQELASWQARTRSCVASVKADLDAAPNPSRDGQDRLIVLVFQTVVDGEYTAFAPILKELHSARDTWKKMKLRDRDLQALARMQSSESDDRPADFPDMCTFYADWKATGFDLQNVPAGTQKLMDDSGNAPSAKAINRGFRVLQALVGKRLARQFDEYPLAPGLATFDELSSPLDNALS